MSFEDEQRFEENNIIIDLRDEKLKEKLEEQREKQFKNIKFSWDD